MSNTLVVDINLGSLRTSNSFLKIMNEKLYFPNYFGFNYNALDECMQDLSWLPEGKIIINFKFIERLRKKNESLYNIIYDCLTMYQEYWQKTQDKKQVVINF
ncbi:barstar family protein [Neisseria sp. Dent CA1/247]|uniref:barstar family protein n=1 Tax=Neisseria sp. Dent CA1/247 TaxID=2912675 RepID=UPI001FD15CB1|nr:barstar family protein [Neisseria sp. Dent CA1/247]UOO76154.1 barstar family protein [Neisseria sp. Dent CA1/247]